MKTKLILVAAAALMLQGLAVPALAQITTGKPSSKVIRTGNRAEAGDFGLYLGANLNLYDGFEGETQFKALPLLNFKYMMTDEAELRLGLELYKDSERANGSVENNSSLIPASSRTSDSRAMLYPGFAWHFSSRNLLDVYVGAELPLGWDNYTLASESGAPDGNGVSTAMAKTTKRTFIVGLGAFIGMQAYIADLPLALGVELGISSRYDIGTKYKHQSETNGSDPQIYYTTTLDPGAVQYDKLRARTGEIVGQARITLTYYFK